MRSFAKMALANRMERNQGETSNRYESNYNRYRQENDGMERNDDPESRRDRRGRYAPKNEYEGAENSYRNNNAQNNYRMGHDEGWIVKPLDRADAENGNIDNRFRDRRGRERYNDGRYAPTRSEYAEDFEPMEETAGNEFPSNGDGSNYRQNYNGSRTIGFNRGSIAQDYKDELKRYREQSHFRQNGGVMDQQKAREWISSLKNSDGTTGEHWSFEKTHQILKQREMECDPAEFYATMNMLWSDYGTVAKKHGVDNVEFWAELSKAFLNDKDAEDGKLMLYYDCIVKK